MSKAWMSRHRSCARPGAMKIVIFLVAFIGISGWDSLAQAQHVNVLKNGRQITVQSYREEGSMIKFVGLGGEIGIPKDQIQAILRPGQTDRTGLSISDLEAPSRQSATAPQKPSPSAARDASQRSSSEEAKPLADRKSTRLNS